MKNPFRYGMRVSGCEFFDRTKIMRDIRNTLDGGNNVLVYGPSRYGKSSLVGEVLAAIRNEGNASVGIKLSQELSEDMVRKVDNVPYYLQALGSWTFNATTGRNGKSVSRNDVNEGFDSLYSAERILHENTFIRHPQSQRLLMRALAIEPASTFPEDYRRRHALASTSTVNTALRRLLAESTVDHEEGLYRLADPILAHHLSSQATI